MDQHALLLPLTALQQRMWHLCTSYVGKSSPIVTSSWRLRGPLDTKAFIRAVEQVVDRHPSLRTRFEIRDGQPWQVVGPTGRFEVECIESKEPGPLVKELSEALLDLERGPLVRSRLIKVDEQDHVWSFSVHHLLADGTSANIIDSEVAALYQGKDLPPAPVSMPELDADCLQWWVDRLTGTPVLDIAPGRPAVKAASSAHLDVSLDNDLAVQLERMARGERATLFMVLLAGYQVMLFQRTGQGDFCVGTPVNGRTEIDQEDAVGLFANMLPLRCNLSADLTFRELMKRIRTDTIEAIARQHVPFGRIVTALGLPHDPSRTQVFQTIFVLHTEKGRSIGIPGLDMEPFASGAPQVLHDLVLDVWRAPAEILLSLRYDKALLTADTVVALAQHYEAVLRAAVADPDARLSALEALL